MEKYVISGGKPLSGSMHVSGAKNVALKAIVASCLTDEEIIIHNVPLISDLNAMSNIIQKLGGKVTLSDHTMKITMRSFSRTDISLEDAAHTRTSSMFLAPLLLRTGNALIPNPGGCRLGARPIDRTVEGLRLLGADISYDSDDGFFHGKGSAFHGTNYAFDKSTHTGTETMIIAAVLAKGKTVLTNAAEEPEVDELIALLTSMGADIKRTGHRIIEITGVEKLHGAEFTVGPDRNEIVTFAIAAVLTKGDIFIHDAKREFLSDFIDILEDAGGGIEEKEDGIRFFSKGEILPTHVMTKPYPGFMTDWQAPWAVLMTQAKGESVVHETVFENRFSYIPELRKMGASITLFNPQVENQKEFYNFNMEDDNPEFFHAAKIQGPSSLHNAIVSITDLRAGATLVLAALAARGETVVHGIHHIKRGYEEFDQRLRTLGADIQVREE